MASINHHIRLKNRLEEIAQAILALTILGFFAYAAFKTALPMGLAFVGVMILFLFRK